VLFMSIITLDGAIAGMQPPRFFSKSATATLVAGRPTTFYTLGGFPGAATASASLNGATISTSASVPAGIVPRTDPVSGNAYLARLSAMASQSGLLLLCDRLWDNGGYTMTSTTAQSITSPTWPARDNAGSTNGDGVLLGMEIITAPSTNTPTITVAYTNSAGTATRSGVNQITTVAAPPVGTFYMITLQAGDTGVRSVQSVTLNASWVTGSMSLVAYRVLASLEMTAGLVPNAVDALTSGFPQIYNGTAPFFVFIPTTTTASILQGTYVETQG
jgi:hypothetical protein